MRSSCLRIEWIVASYVWLTTNLVPEVLDENPRLPLGSA